MNRILMIDDDRELCALVKRSILQENIETDCCYSGKDGLVKLEEKEYQLVILDVMMPGIDGFETMERIREKSSVPILMFTSKDDGISKVRGLRAGAVCEFDGLSIDMDSRSVTTANGTYELPPKEFDVLLLCARNQGKILTKQKIYEAVWKEPYVYDDSNIMAIISRLRKKLEEQPGNPRYIQTVKGIGYRFSKEV